MWAKGRSGPPSPLRGEDDDAIQDMIRELNFGRYAAHPRKKEEGAA